MRHMPAIPQSTRSSITLRLLDHAEKHWPQLDKVEVTCRGGFAYVAGVLPGGGQLPLFRLRYGGSATPSASPSTPPPATATKTPSCSPDSPPAPRRKPSTPPAPSTSPASATNPTSDPRRTYGPTH